MRSRTHLDPQKGSPNRVHFEVNSDPQTSDFDPRIDRSIDRIRFLACKSCPKWSILGPRMVHPSSWSDGPGTWIMVQMGPRIGPRIDPQKGHFRVASIDPSIESPFWPVNMVQNSVFQDPQMVHTSSWSDGPGTCIMVQKGSRMRPQNGSQKGSFPSIDG
jgi:hypothetical protein